MEATCREYEGISSSLNIDFPAKLLKGVLEVIPFFMFLVSKPFLLLFLDVLNTLGLWTFFVQAHLSSCPEKEKGAQERLVEPLMSLVKSYEGGRESHARVIVQTLFEEYLSVEELFSDNIQVSVFK